MEEHERDILHIVHRGSVWNMIGAAYITVRDRARKQQLKEQLQNMRDADDGLAQLDNYIVLIDTSSIQRD